jgi:two-component system, NtrC family, sensor kinase
MKWLLFILLFVSMLSEVAAQSDKQASIYNNPAAIKQATINSLKDQLKRAPSVTARLQILDSLSMYYLYFSIHTDSSLVFSNQSINIAFLLQDKHYLILAYARRANYFWQKTNLKAALENSFQGIKLSKQAAIPDYLSTLYSNIVSIYGQYANDEQTVKNAAYQQQYAKYSKDPFFDQTLYSLLNTGYAYQIKKNYDSAFLNFKKAYHTSLNSKDQVSSDLALWYLGVIHGILKKHALADSIFIKGVEQCKKNYDNQILNGIYVEQAQNQKNIKNFKSAIIAARLGFNNAQSIRDHFATLLSAKLLSDCYDSLGMRDSAFYFLRVTSRMNDSLFNATNVNAMQEVVFSDQIKEKEQKANQILEQEKDRNRLRLYGFVTAIAVFLLLGMIMWRNSRQKEKAYALLQKQKDETDKQKSKAEISLIELRAAQAQLIQSEKMASLGELTAGIAHEIQNPLNFVNNFSETNVELLTELQQELKEGNIVYAQKIAADTIDNQHKIVLHGKRAESIVRSMLEHSRSSKGEKQLTDINALTVEYLRLAYHGFRAKDKTFNTTLQTHFDESIGMLNIVPQDMGRVLLNLFNNAFYAVHERLKKLGGEYEPIISVSTKKLSDKIEISVQDNGMGISKSVLDKIFQPFFTTKPAGQGTGLGLSLSYDIIKAYGGELKVESKESEGARFLVLLQV